MRRFILPDGTPVCVDRDAFTPALRNVEAAEGGKWVKVGMVGTEGTDDSAGLWWASTGQLNLEAYEATFATIKEACASLVDRHRRKAKP